jgi:hypothetical protein
MICLGPQSRQPQNRFAAQHAGLASDDLEHDII